MIRNNSTPYRKYSIQYLQYSTCIIIDKLLSFANMIDDDIKSIILSIDSDRERVSLGIKQLEQD